MAGKVISLFGQRNSPDGGFMGSPVGGALCAATLPHSADLRRNRISLPQHIYHVTKRLEQNRSDGIDLSETGEEVVAAFIHQRTKHACKLFAFVVMPDHIHWLFALPDGTTIADRVKVFSSWTSLQINQRFRHSGQLWQDGYYDHLVREGESISGLVQYIEANPVRKGLCERSEDWEWSSASMRWAASLDRDWLSFHRFE